MPGTGLWNQWKVIFRSIHPTLEREERTALSAWSYPSPQSRDRDIQRKGVPMVIVLLGTQDLVSVRLFLCPLGRSTAPLLAARWGSRYYPPSQSIVTRPLKTARHSDSSDRGATEMPQTMQTAGGRSPGRLHLKQHRSWARSKS